MEIKEQTEGFRLRKCRFLVMIKAEKERNTTEKLSGKPNKRN